MSPRFRIINSSPGSDVMPSDWLHIALGERCMEYREFLYAQYAYESEDREREVWADEEAGDEEEDKDEEATKDEDDEEEE